MQDDTPTTVGILGGMSSQSTMEYYRLVDAGVNDALGGHEAADLLIRSVNFGDVERFIAAERWDEAGEYLAEAARELESGGADVVLLATNTMHRVAPAITAALSVPFVHIVDVTAEAVSQAGLDTVGVLGTLPTMERPFYRDRFADRGIDVVVPDEPTRRAVDEIVFEELTKGVVREESRETYLAAMDAMRREGAQGVVLGCTEIDLLVEQADRPDLPMFDTTALHVERAVELCLRGRTGDETH